MCLHPWLGSILHQNVIILFAASSAEMIIPLEPVTPLELTTDALHTTLATTDTLPNPPTRTLNRLALILSLLILPYVALSTPSLVVSLVEDPPLLPERNTSAIYNPSTILPIPITDAACLPSPSRTMTFTTSTTNKTTPWSSLLRSKTTQSRKSLLSKAALLTSSIGPHIKNSNS